MKQVTSGVLQFLLFFLVFAVGSLLNPFDLKWFVTHPTPLTVRDFSPGGLFLVLGLYLLLLVVAGLRRRLRSAGVVTTIACGLALVIGFLAKFGFATHQLF